MRHVLYGQALFSNATRRNQAANNLAAKAVTLGLTPLAWSGFAAGSVTLTVSSTPALRWCYFTPDQQVARQIMNDVASLFQYGDDTTYACVALGDLP